VLGQFGLTGRDQIEGATILDYFKGSWMEFTIGIPSIIYLLCVFPIFPYVARKQLLTQRFMDSPSLYYCYSLVMACLMSLLQIYNLDPNMLIGFIGAVMCWLVCYFLPIYIDFKERRRVTQTETESLLASSPNSIDG